MVNVSSSLTGENNVYNPVDELSIFLASSLSFNAQLIKTDKYVKHLNTYGRETTLIFVLLVCYIECI